MPQHYELLIIGSGPAGLAAAAHAQANGMKYVLLERSSHIADTIYKYQARKSVMAEPLVFTKRGELPFHAGSRESVLKEWERYANEHLLNIEFGADVKSVLRLDDGFLVRTAALAEYRAANVILAVGTQGDPRRLGVPGEEMPHVFDRLTDAAAYRDQSLVVVGGGDSALEVAIALSDENRIALVVRASEITRANDVLTKEVLSRAARSQLKIFYGATVSSIRERHVDLLVRGEPATIVADAVFLKLGGDPPRTFLEACEIRFSGEGRDARPILSETYETSVKGLYLIGAASGRDLIKLGINQAFEVIEHLLGHTVEASDEAILRERLPFWNGSAAERVAAIRNRVPLLSAAPELLVRDMLLTADAKEYRDGEVIFRQNDYTSDFMIIISGRVGLSRVADESDREVTSWELTAGNFFGELSLISGRRRPHTARAIGATRLVIIPRKAILKFLAGAAKSRAFVDQAFLLRAFREYLFPTIPESLLGELVDIADVVQLGKDAVIYREGDAADAFYLIRSGMVKISKRSADKDVILSYLVAGNFFGESALHSKAKRTETVTTIFPADVIVLSGKAFERFMAHRPDLRDVPRRKLEQNRVAALVAEGTPGLGNVLADLIREEVIMGTQTLLIDEHKCIRCGNCVSACESVHDDGQARLSLTGIRFYNLLAPNSCWQCENPLCMLDCPPDAIHRDPRGEIYIGSNCIGCSNCEKNCPYGNIFMVHREPKRSLFGWIKSLFTSPAAEVQETVAVKCDLCRGVSGGPACVTHCPTGAAVRLTPPQYKEVIEQMVVSRGAR